jgi:peptidoglycan/LPS O-acetylase OafA/YrhL
MTSLTNTTSSTRITLLDIIRNIAIILLLTAHTAQVFGSPLGEPFGIKNFYWATLGGVAVTLFLILSGLTLELKYGTQQIKYKNFIIRRVLRIYPVYYLSLALAIPVYFLQQHMALHWWDIPLTLTGFYAFVGEWGGPFIDTSWFLGLIFIMYFIYPALSNTMTKYNKTIVLVLLLVTSIAFRLLTGNGILSLPRRPLDWFPLCRVFEFGLGVYIGNAFAHSSCFRFKFRHLLLNNFVSTLAILSFPLFLVHIVFRFVITDLINLGIAIPVAITIYIILAVFLSWVINIIDQRIQSALKPLKV